MTTHISHLRTLALGLASAACFMAASSVTAPPAEADTYEPNDLALEAWGPIGTGPDTANFSGVMDTENDRDLFYLYLRPGTNHVRVSITNHSVVDDYEYRSLYLTLMEEDESELTSVYVGEQRQELLTYAVEGPGKVLLGVECSMSSCTPDATSWSLSVLDPSYAPTPQSRVPQPPCAGGRQAAATRALRKFRRARRSFYRHPTPTRRRNVSRAKARYRRARKAAAQGCS